MFESFSGGIHPNDKKSYSSQSPIEVHPFPSKVIIPVRQHIGVPCIPLVKKGDLVKKGQLIAQGSEHISSNIHASISGEVRAISDHPHPIFGKCLSIAIESDGLDEWIDNIPLKRDWKAMPISELIQIIREGGVVGMGGATFPTHVKLQPPINKTVDKLIINGAECEPFLTADHRIMLEYSEQIVIGMKIVMKILGIKEAYIGIEDNKPDAILKMKDALKNTDIQVAVIPTKYPQGAEKMLIRSITGREVPSGSLPLDVGVAVHNVGSMFAIYNVIVHGIPLIERVLTVSGGAIKEPKNLLVRIGTPFSDIIEYCGGFVKKLEKIIMGGPMMGTAQSTTDVPVIKGTSGILCFSKEEVAYRNESNCIRCGRCIKVCPMGLNPCMLSLLAQRRRFEDAKNEYNLFDCCECGSCSYVCPAKRRIIQYIKFSKVLNSAQTTNRGGKK